MLRFTLLHLLLILCARSSSVYAQEENAWSILLDSITIKSYRDRSFVKKGTGGSIIWDMNSMRMLPQIFGNADPMHYAQMLPDIQTNSEYRSGINIEGCDNQHNTISIEGIPIYNVNHLLGFFSTFNSTHFSSMSISKNIATSASPNRLGGQLDMLHDLDVADSTKGIMSFGMIASQGTIRFPINGKTTASASFRGSYINLLYRRWLKAEDQQINYSFYDANISLIHKLNRHHTFLFDFYSGKDIGGFSEDYYFSEMNAKWGNHMAAIHWFYNKNSLSSQSTAYMTTYHNEFFLDMPNMAFQLPSSITDFGLKTNINKNGWESGFETIWHNIHPQSLEHQGNINMTDGHIPTMRSFEASVYGNYEHPFGDDVKVSGGVRGTLFKQKNMSYGAIDPFLSLLYDNHTMLLSMTYALRHQYLFQTGFSDIGLPTEFWISVDNNSKPQYAHELFVSSSSFLFNRRYRISLDLFYRRLYHQVGYKGSVLDYVNSVYDIYSFMTHGTGENYGFSLMLNKMTGPFTACVSYTYTHARRSFDEIEWQDSYPATHERPHELNSVVTYQINQHWNCCGTIVFASGTPFTAAKSIFLLNENLIIKYGEYNMSRLRPYTRLDLSVNYIWMNHTKKERGINISFYNVLCHNNELFYYLSHKKDGSFIYRPVKYVMRLLPSISYYYNF